MFGKKKEPTCAAVSEEQMLQLNKMFLSYQQFSLALLNENGKNLSPAILDDIIEGIWSNKNDGQPAIMDDERLSFLLGSALGFYMTKTDMGRWVNYKDHQGEEIAILDNRGGIGFPFDMIKKRLLQDLGREDNGLSTAIKKIRQAQKNA